MHNHQYFNKISHMHPQMLIIFHKNHSITHSVPPLPFLCAYMYVCGTAIIQYSFPSLALEGIHKKNSHYYIGKHLEIRKLCTLS